MGAISNFGGDLWGYYIQGGNVMHAMAGQLDLRKMSGLGRRMPVTAFLMLIGCLALAGCAEQVVPKEPLRPVRTMQVFATGTERVRSFSGTARASRESSRRFTNACAWTRSPTMSCARSSRSTGA